MSRNPAAILYDANGNPHAVYDGYALPADTPGLIVAGIDDSGNVQFLPISNAGQLKTSTSSRSIVGSYYGCSSLITGQGTAQNLVSIENPTSSGRTIYIHRIEVNGVVSSTFTSTFLYKVGRTTSIPSAGTTLTAQKKSTTDVSPVGVIRQEPTGTAAAGSVWVGSPGILTAGGGQHTNGVFQALVTFDENKEIVLAEGEGLLIEADANSTNWEHWVNVQWNEE